MSAAYVAPGMISRPSIVTLRYELDALEAAGVPVDAPLAISPIANAPGTYLIREVEPRPTTRPCPACGMVVGFDVDGSLNVHGNLNTGVCPGAS